MILKRKWLGWGILAALLLVALFLGWRIQRDTEVQVSVETDAPVPAARPATGLASATPAKMDIADRRAVSPHAATDAPRFNTLPEYRAELASRPAKPQPDESQNGVRTPDSEVRRIQSTLRKYKAVLGQNPVGSNPEITKALLGKNPKSARFLDSASAVMNEKGEWVDDWGKPYFFHAVSASIMETRSSGPDRKLFTPDDIVRP